MNTERESSWLLELGQLILKLLLRRWLRSSETSAMGGGDYLPFDRKPN